MVIMESMVLELMLSMVLMVTVMVIMTTMAIMMVLAVDDALFNGMVAIKMVTIMMKRSLRSARSGSALFLVLRSSLALSCVCQFVFVFVTDCKM